MLAEIPGIVDVVASLVLALSGVSTRVAAKFGSGVVVFFLGSNDSVAEEVTLSPRPLLDS